MENQLESTKVMKKLKVENFTLTNGSDEISALCITGSNLSNPFFYEDRVIDLNEFCAFLRKNKLGISYSLEPNSTSLVCQDLARFLNEKEGRTEEMEEPFFPKSAYQLREENPITNILKPFL